MALRAQVVNFVWLCFLHDANKVAGVAQITEVQFEVGVVDVRVLIDVVHPLGVERTGPSLDEGVEAVVQPAHTHAELFGQLALGQVGVFLQDAR